MTRTCDHFHESGLPHPRFVPPDHKELFRLVAGSMLVWSGKSAYTCWAFVIHQPLLYGDHADEAWLDFHSLIKDTCKAYHYVHVVATAEGDADATYFVFGRVSLLGKRQSDTIHNMFQDTLLTGASWVPSTVNSASNGFYDLPLGFAGVRPLRVVDGPWSTSNPGGGTLPQHVLVIRDTPYPWQEEILRDIKRDVAGRTINVLFDPDGARGKSTLAVYASCIGLSTMIPPIDSFQAIMHHAASSANKRAFFYDVPRAIPAHLFRNVISAMEQTKNGVYQDLRYKTRTTYGEQPHMWIFSNNVLPRDMLTEDRWKYWIINTHLSLEAVKLDDITQYALAADFNKRVRTT